MAEWAEWLQCFVMGSSQMALWASDRPSTKSQISPAQAGGPHAAPIFFWNRKNGDYVQKKGEEMTVCQQIHGRLRIQIIQLFVIILYIINLIHIFFFYDEMSLKTLFFKKIHFIFCFICSCFRLLLLPLSSSGVPFCVSFTTFSYV